MSNENLRVQYGEFRESARSYDDIGHKLDRLQLRMQARTDAEGTCWGSDEPGSTFADGYESAAGETMSALDRAARRVDDVARNVRANADNYDATDRGFRDGLSGIDGPQRWG
ncbi:WXG100 family type VII secretion target [Aldersonia kunmingensis]|uniref:WXG100 family type VII secretion target n=1 Tax=Aldersonia kunmingensis TaxID=408066 RepID=UPI0008301972|nr:type VII secretion target [Aldersonia kunmingensis]